MKAHLKCMRLRLPASNCSRRQIVDLLLLTMEIICNIAFPGCLVLQPDNPVVDLGQVEPGGEEGGRGDPHLAQPHLQGLWTLHLQVFFNVPDCWCIMTMDVSLNSLIWIDGGLPTIEKEDFSVSFAFPQNFHTKNCRNH